MTDGVGEERPDDGEEGHSCDLSSSMEPFLFVGTGTWNTTKTYMHSIINIPNILKVIESYENIQNIFSC